MIEVEDDGDRMTERELLDTTMLLYVAGHETTVNLIGNGTAALLAHPDQMDLFRADPSLDANAMEELLRFDSPVQFARRISIEPVVVRDEQVPAGAVVILATGSANRDPRQWGPTADSLDVRRETRTSTRTSAAARIIASARHSPASRPRSRSVDWSAASAGSHPPTTSPATRHE